MLLPILTLGAGTASGAEAIFPIWQGKPPGSENWQHAEITYAEPVSQQEGEASAISSTLIRNVVTPTLTGYFPDPGTAIKAAVVICPGGGLRFLTWQVEGTDLARWFAAHGVAAFVLKYRLVQTAADPVEFAREIAAFRQEFFQAIAFGKRPLSLEEILSDQETRKVRALAGADARQAVKYVRSRAVEWGITPGHIGMLGFSVGGFLVTDAIMASDPGSRLDFAAVIYGGEVSRSPIPAGAPPLFMVVAQDDRWMSRMAIELFTRWDLAGHDVEFHYFDSGGHGFGTSRRNLPVDQWTTLLGRWMASRGLMGAFDE